MKQKDAAGVSVHLTETMCVLSVVFITEGLRDSSICCLHFVLNQQAVPGIFNHSLDGATGLPSRPKMGLTLFNTSQGRTNVQALGNSPTYTHTLINTRSKVNSVQALKALSCCVLLNCCNRSCN